MKLPTWQKSVVRHPQGDISRYRSAGLWSGSTIGSELHRIAASTPAAIALAGPGRVLSWAELDTETDRIAAGLLATGLQPGDAVLLQLDNSVDMVLTWYGVLKATLVPVATLSAHRGHEMREIGALTRAQAHIVDATHSKFDLIDFALRLTADSDGPARQIFTVGANPDQQGIRIEDIGRDFTVDEARRTVEAAQNTIDDEDVAVFQLSGGTTGTPKVIPRLHGEYWYNSRAYAERQQWDENVRVTHFGPLVHNAGIVCAMHAAHSVGGALIVADPAPDVLLSAMTEHAVTDLILFPGLVPPLRSHPAWKRAIAAVRQVTFTIGPVTPDLYDEFTGYGVRVMGLYGMGEGFCAVTATDDPPSVRRRSIGHPISHLDEYRIVEPGTDTPVASGEVGELCCRGPYTIRGYLAAPDRNAEAFTEDGFYRTGDLMREWIVDGVRSLTFEGRDKDLISRGGEKVASVEIESLIAELSGIRRVALVPLPDERLGERGCVCIEPSEPGLTLQVADIQKFLALREVARYKWPERVEMVDELPLTPVGKINKKQLIAEVLARDVR